MNATRRSSTGWRELLSDSRSSALAAPRPHPVTAPVMLAAAPDHRKTPARGTLIKGSIRARVLGVQLLTLDATLVLVPTDVSAPPSVAADQLQRTSGPTSSGAARTIAVGPGLDEAVRSISEGAALLAQSRRSGL